MTVVHLKRSDRTVDSIVRLAFPAYTGQKVQANITDTIQFYNTMWDGGSRRTYVYVDLACGRAVQVQQASFLQRDEFYEKQQPIPEGFVCVVHAECRSEHIEIHGPAANLSPLLPKTTELTDDEKTVLIATRSYKSSYAGISNYRFHEATSKTGITLERWEAAKAILITKGFLNKAGAITVDGKNAVGLERLPYRLAE